MHGIAEQIRIMNEINACLVQHLATNNPPPPTAPIPKDANRFHRSRRSSDQDFPNQTQDTEGEETRRNGRSPLRDDRDHKHRDKSTTQKIKDLDVRIDAINMGVNTPVTIDFLIRYSNEVMCKTFSTNLKGPARSWFKKLSLRTINSFGYLIRLFITNFMSCKVVLVVEDPNDKVVIMTMIEGLHPDPLFDSLSKNVHKTLSELQSKADKYVAAKELIEAKSRKRGRDDHKRKEFDTQRTDYRGEMKTYVLMEIKNEDLVKWLEKIKTNPIKKNKNKYCELHKNHCHNTEDCFQLQEYIANLIKRGYLRKFVDDRLRPDSPDKGYADNKPTVGDIQTIHGGFGLGGCSSSSQKRHAREASGRAEEVVYKRKIHEGICENYSKARSLVRKVVHQGYFWPQIERDAMMFTRKCDKFQRFTPVNHLPHIEMMPMTNPWPFV
ncbi:hypothetical protein Acr_27g0002440 [Actinidia rufa]|uniref:Reverse transcriptase domain-containing protein n=1 Tax=Actinidia rufa TaxID=165716 RepID=A0A7J0H6C8_9ERIC|nr:hypothetical protein Acr_27g0002440 [Actinidia rufa]